MSTEQKVSVGRVVRYKLTFDDAIFIERCRGHADASGLKEASLGVVLHRGNSVVPGEVFPMTVTRDGPGNTVDGQVFFGGDDPLSVLNVAFGDGDGQWSWPPRLNLIISR